MNVITKKQVFNNLLFNKYAARKQQYVLSQAMTTIKMGKRLAKKEKNPFVGNYVKNILSACERVQVLFDKLKLEYDEICENIMSGVLWLDKHGNLTLEEKSFLIGVHHGHVEKIISEQNQSDLLMLVALHAEMTYSSDWTRDHVLFDAYINQQSKLFKSNSGFMDAAMGMLQKMAVENTGHPLKIYRLSESGEMIVCPPKLTVVK